MKTSAYNHLSNLCLKAEHRNTSTCKDINKPIFTERVKYIVNALAEMGVTYTLDIFSSYGEMFVNVEVFFKGLTNETKGYIAHHDINNPNSENCNDNSASVSILLDFVNEVKNRDILIDNVLVVFTDNEEFGFSGAKRMAKNIQLNKYENVKFVVNLELTAFGTEFWQDSDKGTYLSIQLEKEILNTLEKNLFVVKTPPNDSMILRERGVDSICIGTLPKLEMDIAFEKNYCSTWGTCHKLNDTFDKANGEDMNIVKNLLIELL